MKIFYFYLIFIAFSTNAQTFDWLQSATYSSETQGDWVGIDITGNLYVAGTCFNSDHGSVANRANAFLSKYSPDGNLLWTDTLTGVISIQCDLDADGNTYATGRFIGTANFGNSQTLTSNNYNSYIAKYSPEGQCLYLNNLSFISTQAICLNVNGGYTLVGISGSGQYSVTLGATTFNRSGFFLARFDAHHNCLWGIQTDGTTYSFANKIIEDNAGNIYVSGFFSDSICVVTGNGNFKIVGMEANAFIFKLDSSGNLIWKTSISSPAMPYHPPIIQAISFDEKDNLYATGYFDQQINFSGITLNHSGVSEASVMIKYDNSGALKDYKIIDGGSSNIQIHDIKYLSEHFYITGSFRNTIDFGGQTVALGSNYNQLFIAKYDTAFNLQWVKNSVGLIGLSGYQDGSARATSFFVRGNTIGITGAVSKKVDFGGIIYNGDDDYPDMFVLKFSDTTTVTNILNIFSSQNKFSIYPNPNQGIFAIQLSTEKKEKLLLTIVDAKGQQIYTETISDFQGELKKEIDLSRNAKGIYFIHIQNGKGTKTKKIVLE